MELINDIAIAWWGWMGQMLWQVSVLILLVSGVDMLLRRWAWPQVRYALWLLVLAKLVIPPSWSLPSSVISHVQPRITNSFLATSPIESQASGSKRGAQVGGYSFSPVAPLVAPEGTIEETTSQAGVVPAARFPVWQVYAMAVWFLGMLIFLGLLFEKMARLRRWHQRQKDNTIPQWFHELLVQTARQLNMQRLPAIVFSKNAKCPAVYGLFRPVLLLPADYFDHLSHQEAEHVLLHELAHLKRGDLWFHGLCLFLQIVYWFNPLVAWMRRQMKHVREICCDLTVANILKEKTMDYRQTLLNTARKMLTETVEPGLGLLGVFEDPFRLVSRLKWLEKKTWNYRTVMMTTAGLVILLMAAFVMPMAGIQEEISGEDSVVLSTNNRAGSMEAAVSDLKDTISLQIEVKQIDELYAVVLPVTGPYDTFDEAINMCRQLLDEAGILPVGDPFARYFSDSEKVPVERLSWEVGFPVATGTVVASPLETIHVSSRQVASTTIEGIKDTDLVWQVFVESMVDQGLIPAYPPAVEIFIQQDEEQPIWWFTELQIQVLRPGEGYPGLEMTMKESDPIDAILLPVTGSYAQHGAAVAQLTSYLEDKGITPSGDLFGLFYSDASEVSPALYYWEVGYPVAGAVDVEAPYELRRLDFGLVATAVVPGYSDVEYPWAPMIYQVFEQGYFPFVNGPAMEVWHQSSRGSTGGPETEMRLPVIKVEDFAEGMAEWGQQVGAYFEAMADSVRRQFEEE